VFWVKLAKIFTRAYDFEQDDFEQDDFEQDDLTA
jgi:hypothetical protein